MSVLPDGPARFPRPDPHPIKPSMTINGQRVDSSETFEVLNPATEEVIGVCPDCDWETIDFAVTSAKVAYLEWRERRFEERAELVRSLADAVERHSEELADLLVLEQGKPRARAVGEISSSLSHCRALCEMSPEVEILEDSGDRRVELHRRPIGVVGAITPWNYPILLSFWKLAPALLTGNTVILKPSSSAPLTSLRIGEIAQEILPPGVFNVITGTRGGHGLTTHHDVGKIAFTGSIETGRQIMSNAGPTLKRLTLELGGNDAGILLDDIDASAIADELIWAGFSNCGQVCAGLKRLYVPDSIYDQVCEALTEAARCVVVGDGRLPDVQMGPIQNREQFQKVSELVEDAKDSGAEVIHGGSPYDGKGYFYPITLLRNVEEGVRVVDEEPFGPALPILRYREVAEVIERANASPFGLGASVWTSDIAKATEVASALEAGSAWVNQHPSMAPHIPFGGIKQSGIGVELSRYGMEAYTDFFVMNVKKMT